MIKQLLQDYVSDLTGRNDIVIDVPPNPEMGDYSCAVAFQMAKEQRRNPLEVARELIAAMERSRPRLVERITNAGPYINFFVDGEAFAREALGTILSQDRGYGTLPPTGKRVIVEHTSVNPNKPLHMGGARNSILGDSVARLLRAAGYEVEVENYIDDLGIQFAEVFWGILQFGDTPEEKYDHFLGKLYIRVHETLTPELEGEIKRLNKEMEDPSSPHSAMARAIVERCVMAQLSSLKTLGIGFDILVWESDIVHAGLFDETFELLGESEDIVTEDDGPLAGCLVMKLGRVFPNMTNPDKVLIRSDGTPTYTAKDIALQMWKFGLLSRTLLYRAWDGTTMTSDNDGEPMDFGNADMVINVIGSEQSYPQEVVKRSLKLLGFDEQSEQSHHLAYEFVTLPDDSFSGRRGTWIGYTLDDVLSAGRAKALEAVTQRRSELTDEERGRIADVISAGSIRYNIARYAPEKKIVFRWDDALNLEGDSCPYVEYAHARCCAILRKAAGTYDHAACTFSYAHPKEWELVKALSEYPDVIASAAADKRPHYVTKYVNDISLKFNSFYNDLLVIGSDNEANRLALVDATRTVLANALRVLGIEPLDEM